jgi:hypothetical protein
MATIREDLIFAAIQKANSLIDFNIHDNIVDIRHEFKKQIIIDDKYLTKDEKVSSNTLFKFRL